jgi:uncharacterized protein (DUF983 family)
VPKKAYIKIKEPKLQRPVSTPPSKFRSIVQGRCPRCRRGKVFQKPFWHPGFSRMNKKCPHCNFRYEIEPGFFWGAMYVNYALSVFIAGITGGVVSLSITEPSVWTLLIYFLSFVPFEKDKYVSGMHKHN